MSTKQINLPIGWKWSTITDLLDRLQYGYTAKAKPDLNGTKFLRITDIQELGVDWDAVPGCEITTENMEKYRLFDGDIVFARSGSIEKAWRVSASPNAVFASYLIYFYTKNQVGNIKGHFSIS